MLTFSLTVCGYSNRRLCRLYICLLLCFKPVGRDSVVGIATGYGRDGSGI